MVPEESYDARKIISKTRYRRKFSILEKWYKKIAVGGKLSRKNNVKMQALKKNFRSQKCDML